MKKWLTWFEGEEDNNRRKNPWGSSRQSPPDLDEALKKLQQRLKQAFRGQGGKPINVGNGSGLSFVGGAVLIVALVIWILSGIFIIEPAEQAVITRFGRYTETLDSGIHWIPTFIDRKYVINVQQIFAYQHPAQMLTEDENIVSVSIVVHFRIGNAKDYEFSVVKPEESLQQATASALRQVIGHTKLDDILTTGREKVRQEVRQVLEQILSRYQTGLMLMDVVMQPARAPEEVKSAFDDAIKAQEDEQRFVNEAEAYAMKIVPIAKGEASRVMQEAEAYRQERVMQAEGDVARFKALLPEYKRAPQLTKERLYLDCIESVLTKTNKILVDIKDSNNLLYLPLDRLIKMNELSTEATNTSKDSSEETSNKYVSTRDRELENKRNTATSSRAPYDRVSERRGYP